MCKGKKPADVAAEKQSALSDEMANIGRQRESYVGPYLQSRTQGGLPFMKDLMDYSGGTTARAFAPARANLSRRLSSMGPLPSGFAEQAKTGLDTSQARAYDDSMVRNLMMDEETRARAAGGAQPGQYFSGAQQGFGGIMNMPQQPSILGSLLGGAGAAGIGLL